MSKDDVNLSPGSALERLEASGLVINDPVLISNERHGHGSPHTKTTFPLQVPYPNMASSAPNSPLFIPQDIINTIVDELHRQHDTSTLSTCARTAHAFRDPCQRHLFHTLSLSNAAPDANQCLLAVLRASVRLQSYPRHFHLRLISLYGTVRAEGALPDILQLLPQLRTFSLAHGITSGLLHFGSISHALKASIFGLLQGEHLGRVDLAHLQEFPIYFLSRCPQLEALTLRDVNPFHIDMWFEPDPELVPAHAHGEPLPGNELRELELRMECNPSWSFVHAQTFGHIRTTVNLERLTKIAIGHLAGDEEVEECWRILEASRILEELEVTLDLSSGMDVQRSVNVPSLIDHDLLQLLGPHKPYPSISPPSPLSPSSSTTAHTPPPPPHSAGTRSVGCTPPSQPCPTPAL